MFLGKYLPLFDKSNFYTNRISDIESFKKSQWSEDEICFILEFPVIYTSCVALTMMLK